MSGVRELPSTVGRFERVGAHTHIKGLGLDENLRAVKIKDGMVGQERAREAAGLVVQMIKQGKLSGRLVILAGPPGTGKCVTAETPILLANGEIWPAERLFNEISKRGRTVYRSDGEVVVEPGGRGPSVVSLNPRTLKLEFKPVSYAYKQRILEPLYRIKTASGREVTVTKKHPLLVMEGSPRFKPAEEIKPGDYVAAPRALKVKPNAKLALEPGALKDSRLALDERRRARELALKLRAEGASCSKIARRLGYRKETVERWLADPPTFESAQGGTALMLFKAKPASRMSRVKAIALPAQVTPELAEFMGYLLSESDEYLDEDLHIYSIRFHNRDPTLLARFSELCAKLFGLRARDVRQGRTPAKRVSSWSLATLLRAAGYAVGRKSREKEIPNFILRGNNEAVASFLRAFCDGEASVEKEGITISTASHDIAHKLLYLFARFGVIARMRIRLIKLADGQSRPYYLISITGNENLQSFWRHIGFNVEGKNRKLKALLAKRPHTNVDCIPNLQETLRRARESLGIPKERFYGSKSGYRYELPSNAPSHRRISRAKLRSIVNKLGPFPPLINLARSEIFWDEVRSVEVIRPSGPINVYDFCVDDDCPTFIAGFGGLVLHNTAIAVAIARELGPSVPFIQLSGGEIYSTERKKTEVLMEAIRKCIGIEIHEQREVYEGEVAGLDVKLSPHPYNPYQRVPESARITLKTTEEEKTIEVGSSIAQQVIAQGVSEGDVIQIDSETGRLVNLGVSTEHSKSKLYEVGRERRVPRPSGRVKKEKEFVYVLTLHDMDKMAARRSGGSLLSLFFDVSESKEISPDVRASVDAEVKEMVDQGKAFIHPGVLFIDDSHLLDLEAFSFLGRALESELVPIVILATNRGVTKIRGTDVESPFGFPLDLIDRSVIIMTEEYDAESIREILKIRANEEKVKVSGEALEKLTEIGVRTSLRYAVQLLSFAAQSARIEKRSEVNVDDVNKVNNLFADVGEATKYLRKYEEKLLKH